MIQRKKPMILKKDVCGTELPFLLKLDRNKNLLDIYKKQNCEKIYDAVSIRKSYPVDSYVLFEHEKSFPCIFGGATSPTPNGIFQIEEKSDKEYISTYYPNYKRVKFFGYLVIFEDFFIHSDLYHIEENNPIFDRAISRNDKETSGCIRVSQENLQWLVQNIDVGTLVLL